jgi:myo-inositol-1-phosphate synthase
MAHVLRTEQLVKRPEVIEPPTGKLGVLTPGLGAVSTTMMAGVFLARRGMAEPVGSLTQLGTIRLGKRTKAATPRISDFLGLASLDDIVFGAWDIFPEDAYESAVHADVSREHLDLVRDELHGVRPMPGVFYRRSAWIAVRLMFEKDPRTGRWNTRDTQPAAVRERGKHAQR